MIEGKVDLTAFVKRHPASITERQCMPREQQVASQNYFGSASTPPKINPLHIMPLIIAVADSVCHLQLLSQMCDFTQRKMYNLIKYSCFGCLNKCWQEEN